MFDTSVVLDINNSNSWDRGVVIPDNVNSLKRVVQEMKKLLKVNWQ